MHRKHDGPEAGKNRDEELLATRQQSEDIIQSLPDPTFVIDRDKKIVVWNRAIEEMTGVPSRDMIGKGDKAYSVPFWGEPRQVLIDLVMEDDRESPLPYKSIQRQGDSLISEAFLPGFRDGKGIHVWLKASPLYDRNGNLIGAIESIRDITERKQAEDERRQKVAFLENMERIDRIIAQSMDLEDMMGDVLEAVLAIFSCDRAWLLYPCDPDADVWRIPMEKTRPAYPGASVKNRDYPMTSDVRESCRELLAADGPCVDDLAPHEPEWDPDDVFKVRSAMAVAIRPKTGKPWSLGLHQCNRPRTWTVSEQALFKEIARRIEAGLSSLLFYRDLKASEARYRLIAENVTDVIWTMDTKFNFTYLSPSILQQTGYTVAEAMAHSRREVLPDTLRTNMTIFRKKLRQIETGDLRGWEPAIFELEQRCKGGHTIWTHNNARILPGPEQEPASILGITRDITDLKQTQEIMVQSEKMMSVGGLAAGMAHEINNPLAGMIQTSEVVRNRLTDTRIPANRQAARKIGISMAQIRTFMAARGIPRMLDAIHESGHRMAAIVDNMLNFARKGNTEVSSHDLRHLLDKTLELACTDFDLKKRYDFKAIVIHTQCDEPMPPVPCEGAKIQQVLLNILRNGAQAMQEAGVEKPAFRIRIYTDQQRKMACIDITDNGPGMAETTRKRVFEPFFTTKPVGVGTGLGLSVSYFIITENHGGDMHVESKPGRGTTFFVGLPLEGPKK